MRHFISNVLLGVFAFTVLVSCDIAVAEQTSSAPAPQTSGSTQQRGKASASAETKPDYSKEAVVIEKDISKTKFEKVGHRRGSSIK
jgi:hypothetical protein